MITTMAKIVRHDFGAIHEALNKMIVAEVKAALELLPGKKMETAERLPLCYLVVSSSGDYCPRDLDVKRVWLDGDNELCFSEYTAEEDEDDVYTWTEYDDLLDITDFGYLLDQIAARLEGDKTYNLPNMSLLTAGYVTEATLRQAVDKTVTV